MIDMIAMGHSAERRIACVLGGPAQRVATAVDELPVAVAHRLGRVDQVVQLVHVATAGRRQGVGQLHGAADTVTAGIAERGGDGRRHRGDRGPARALAGARGGQQSVDGPLRVRSQRTVGGHALSREGVQRGLLSLGLVIGGGFGGNPRRDG